jgi:hypothetical protein
MFDQAHGFDDIDDEHGSRGTLDRAAEKQMLTCYGDHQRLVLLASASLPAPRRSFATPLRGRTSSLDERP